MLVVVPLIRHISINTPVHVLHKQLQGSVIMSLSGTGANSPNSPFNHPTYYPSSQQLTRTRQFNPSSKLIPSSPIHPPSRISEYFNWKSTLFTDKEKADRKSVV